MSQAAQNQVDANYTAFEVLLPEILPGHEGEFALLNEGEVVEYFESSLEATIAGAKQFGLGHFSVQEVSAEPEHLGFYSYVGGTGNY
jgi:hypothetical protein